MEWRRGSQKYSSARSASLAATEKDAIVDVGTGSGDVFLRVRARNEIGASTGGEATCSLSGTTWTCTFVEAPERSIRGEQPVRRWPEAEGPFTAYVQSNRGG